MTYSIKQQKIPDGHNWILQNNAFPPQIPLTIFIIKVAICNKCTQKIFLIYCTTLDDQDEQNNYIWQRYHNDQFKDPMSCNEHKMNNALE